MYTVVVEDECMKNLMMAIPRGLAKFSNFSTAN